MKKTASEDQRTTNVSNPAMERPDVLRAHDILMEGIEIIRREQGETAYWQGLHEIGFVVRAGDGSGTMERFQAWLEYEVRLGRTKESTARSLTWNQVFELFPGTVDRIEFDDDPRNAALPVYWEGVLESYLLLNRIAKVQNVHLLKDAIETRLKHRKLWEIARAEIKKIAAKFATEKVMPAILPEFREQVAQVALLLGQDKTEIRRRCLDKHGNPSTMTLPMRLCLKGTVLHYGESLEWQIKNDQIWHIESKKADIEILGLSWDSLVEQASSHLAAEKLRHLVTKSSTEAQLISEIGKLSERVENTEDRLARGKRSDWQVNDAGYERTIVWVFDYLGEDCNRDQMMLLMEGKKLKGTLRDKFVAAFNKVRKKRFPGQTEPVR